MIGRTRRLLSLLLLVISTTGIPTLSSGSRGSSGRGALLQTELSVNDHSSSGIYSMTNDALISDEYSTSKTSKIIEDSGSSSSTVVPSSGVNLLPETSPSSHREFEVLPSGLMQQAAVGDAPDQQQTVGVVHPNYKTPDQIFAEKREEMLTRAEEQAAAEVLRAECKRWASHLSNMQYASYDTLQRKCTMHCSNLQKETFWNHEHTCVVRQLRQFLEGEPAPGEAQPRTAQAAPDETASGKQQPQWMWHFGQWKDDDCMLDEQTGYDNWFIHDGCYGESGVKDGELCTGCFHGCPQPEKTNVAMHLLMVHKSRFLANERVTFECQAKSCWTGGVTRRQLQGQCYCTDNECRFATCSGSNCTPAPEGQLSLVAQGCSYQEGGCCVRPVNARECERGGESLCNGSRILYEDDDSDTHKTFRCAALETTLETGGTLVSVPRCWQNGSDEALVGKCVCFNKDTDYPECSFREIDPFSGSGEVSNFLQGCLVEYCPSPNNIAQGVVSRLLVQNR